MVDCFVDILVKIGDFDFFVRFQVIVLVVDSYFSVNFVAFQDNQQAADKPLLFALLALKMEFDYFGKY